MRCAALAAAAAASRGAAPPGAGPTVALHDGVSNVADPSDKHVVLQLGSGRGNATACEAACLATRNAGVSRKSGWARCQSFTLLASGACYGVYDAEWAPRTARGAVSGTVTYPPRSCADVSDCSGNGECRDALCACADGWTGDLCQTLDLLPATEGAGLWSVDDGVNTSSWGGSVVRGDDGKYHMWAAEMVNHCGINACGRNSHIVHAVSTDPHGAYTRRDVVFPPFAHCPDVVRAPTGEYVMYFLGSWSKRPRAPCDCNATGTGGTGKRDCGRDGDEEAPVWPPPGKAGSSWMSWAPEPDGPWSEPQVIFTPGQWHEQDPIGTNLAVLILPNGSAVGLIRMSQCGAACEGSTIHLITAARWKDPSTYALRGSVDTPLLSPDDVNPDGLEDPSPPWIDEAGRYHALFHQQTDKGDVRIVGGHAFSLDGIHWTYTGTAYTNRVRFAGGTELAAGRRERPHAVFGDPTRPHRLTAVVTGTQWGDSTWNNPTENDHCVTFLQPVR